MAKTFSSPMFVRSFRTLPLAWLIAVGLAQRGLAITPTDEERADAKAWVDANLLSDGKFPFDFMYAQQGSAGILPTWEKKRLDRPLSPTSTFHEFVYSDPATGLEVRCEATEYSDFPAVEWVLHFANKGPATTPVLQNVLPLNTEIANSTPGAAFRIRYSLGSHERSDDFRVFETQTVSPAETLTLGPFGGRSSDGCLPFFNLLKESGGVCLGLGWTGQWQTTFRHNESNAMGVRAGMEFTHFKLRPGESVRTPSILLVFWNGKDAMRGHNMLRAVLREHFSPRPSGKPMEIPISLSAHGTYPFETTTAEQMVECIRKVAAHDAGFDTFWIDTGWFELIDNNWARSVGNFDPDKERYPDGMKPVSDAAHDHGMKFLLWFEPERVMRDTWLMKTHPKWLIGPPINLPFELSYQFFDGFHLLDLGNEQARDWLIKKTIAQIKDMGVDVFRQDFNMYPLYYWRAKEPDDRLGIREMHYVDGLYKYWDQLLKEYPHLLIDNCASGGRRIDFEMLRRSVVLFRSDMAFRSPLANQCQQYALSHWIPFHGVGTVTVDPYAFRSGLGAVFTTAFNLNESDDAWKQLGVMIKQYRRFRVAYEGDFYPLTPYTLSPDSGMAWQFDRPDLGEGLVQAFRREGSEADSVKLKLRALESSARYTLTNLDHPKSTQSIKGSTLMSEGLRIPMPTKPSAALILYKKK